MKPICRLPALILPLLVLPGCVASTVANVVTAPVRVAGKAVDMATTSQSEADENRGRAMRHQDERMGKLRRAYAKHMKQCNDGQDDACLKARDDYAQMQQIQSRY